MLHLLQLEWKKLRHYRMFTVLMVLYLIGMPAAYIALQNLPGLTDVLPNGTKSFFSFPHVWRYLGYQGSWMTFFCFGFLGVTLVTMEVSNKTMRQNVITGMSRETFFLGKIYALLAISLVATLYYTFLSLLFGYLNTDYIMASRVTRYIDLVPRFWLLTFGYMSFAFFLGMWIRRGGVALFIYFSYVILGEIILRYGLHRYLLMKQGLNKYLSWDSINYYPLNSMEDLVPMPFPEDMMKGPMEEAVELGYNFFLTPTQAIGLSSFYILLFLGLAYWLFKRRDL